MENYIPISMLNDFVFCPYSIYLHNVYMEADEGLYHATPQLRGKMSHQSVDEKMSNRKVDFLSLPVCSNKYRLFGRIDLLKTDKKQLIEKKYSLKQIFKGQIYQLWAQYFCLQEMGYEVEHLAFYEISTNKIFEVMLPTKAEEQEFPSFINLVHNYSPEDDMHVNLNKCRHCIYCSMCDKTSVENVY